MLTISLSHNIDAVTRGLDDISKRQIPFATAQALTKTVQAVREDLKGEMKRVFDRPTPYTLNSLFIKPATKQRLEAKVWLKDDTGLGTPPSHYLRPQIEGGGRVPKRFERWLMIAGYLPAGWFAVPGAGARFDAYGNMSRGQITQILSALKASPDPLQNRTNSPRSLRNARKAQYFVGRPGGGRLPLGVWQRFSFAHGSAIKPVLTFVSRAPHYSVRLKFFETARQTIDRELPRQFESALSGALATAR